MFFFLLAEILVLLLPDPQSTLQRLLEEGRPDIQSYLGQKQSKAASEQAFRKALFAE